MLQSTYNENAINSNRLSLENQAKTNRNAKVPKKIADINESWLLSGSIVYTGPVASAYLPKSTGNAQVIEVFPEKIHDSQSCANKCRNINKDSSTCDLARALAYLVHINRSSSIHSTPDSCFKKSTPDCLQVRKDCRTASNKTGIQCYDGRTDNKLQNEFGNCNYYSLVVNGRSVTSLVKSGITTKDKNELARKPECLSAHASYSLLLVVDCRTKTHLNTVELIFMLHRALIKLCEICQLIAQTDIKLILVEPEERLKEMLEEAGIKEFDVLTASELHEQFKPDQLSDGLRGERKYDASQWVRFRKDLEHFVNRCQTAAKFYINSMKRLKVLLEENSYEVLWHLSDNDIQQRSLRVHMELSSLNDLSANCSGEFPTEGRQQLQDLINRNNALETLPHYKEAILKVSTFFDEVCRVLNKYDRESCKLLQIFDHIANLRDRVKDLETLIHWFSTDALEIMKNYDNRPSGSKDAMALLNELQVVETQYFQPNFEKFDCVFAKPNDIKFQTDEPKRILLEIDCMEQRLKNLVEESKVRLNLTKNYLQICNLCYQSCDEAYEWALDCLKFTSNLKKSLSVAPATSANNNFNLPNAAENSPIKRENILEFRMKLDKYILENPVSNRRKFERMKAIAEEVQDERLLLQCQAVETRCSETEQMLSDHQIYLDSILMDWDQLTCDDASPSKQLTPTSADHFAGIRRRSYAGSHSAIALRDIARMCNGKLAKLRRSLDCLIEENEQCSSEDQQKASIPETDLNVTENDALQERLAERRDLLNKIEAVCEKSTICGAESEFLAYDADAAVSSSKHQLLSDVNVNTRFKACHRAQHVSPSNLETISNRHRLSLETLESGSNSIDDDSLRSLDSYSSRSSGRPFPLVNSTLMNNEESRAFRDLSIDRYDDDDSPPPFAAPTAPPAAFAVANSRSEPPPPLFKEWLASSSSSLQCASRLPAKLTSHRRQASASASLMTSSNDLMRPNSARSSIRRMIVPKSDQQRPSSTLSSSASSSNDLLSVEIYPWSTTSPIAQLNDSRFRLPTPPPDASPSVRMKYNVVNELLQTEIAYIRSLQYVIENYIPEMRSLDLPKHLAGKRAVIFGNLEKIYEFHVSSFLPDLMRHCLKSSESVEWHVSRCFMRHKARFHLYALYSKNKPKADALMAEYGSSYFKKKQLALNDKMDLSSYLLKPVQRIGKYTLMMQNLVKVCPAEDQEQMEMLKGVEDMLIFQLRHGNDLLAMDSIHNCDLSLKEQGQLLRQEEFFVFEGRSGKKCLRRLFLFENLVLFTKPRRQKRSSHHVGALRCSDVYEYKYSVTMTDVGLTETVADSELKFELWFRRHTSNVVFVILTPSLSIKNVWVEDLKRLLWQQAIRNREDRLSEMTSMGISDKACLDLKDSQDRIQNRAVDNRFLIKASRSRSLLPSVGDAGRLGLQWAFKKLDATKGGERPRSLVSVQSSGASSSASGGGGSSGVSCRRTTVSATTSSATPMSSESGFGDLVTLEEYPDDSEACTAAEYETSVA